jgi:hypothetical protein
MYSVRHNAAWLNTLTVNLPKSETLVKYKYNMVNKKNPFAGKAKSTAKKKTSGKRVGKSRPEKANNQLNRRVK